jgi:hypothetical protein
MAAPAASKAEGIKISFVAVRKVSGEVELMAVGESSDPALELHEKLKKTKGKDADGNLLYTECVLFVRPRSNRRLKFS